MLRGAIVPDDNGAIRLRFGKPILVGPSQENANEATDAVLRFLEVAVRADPASWTGIIHFLSQRLGRRPSGHRLGRGA